MILATVVRAIAASDHSFSFSAGLTRMTTFSVRILYCCH